MLNEKFGVPGPDGAKATKVFAECSVVATPDPLPALDSPDPSDIPLLAAAVSARADLFVTGDRALLEMKSIEGVPIVSPRVMYERLIRAR